MVTVTVKLFAAYQDALGQSELTLAVPSGTTVEQVGDRIRSTHPGLSALAGITRYGINLAFVEPATPVQEGDEVVLIPPVSGG